MSVTHEGALEAAEIHDVLRNDRRRLAINVLQDAEDGSMSVRDLSEAVATLETGEDPPPRNKRQSVYVSLHQTPLPKLDNLGIVEYDGDAKLVTLRERVREVEVYMEVVPKYGLSWGEYYLSLAVLGMLTTVASEFGVPMLATAGPSVVAGAFFVLFVVSAVYHVKTQQDGWPFSRLL